MILTPAFCIACDAPFRILAEEWPPKVMVCPSCSTPMKLHRQTDEKTCTYTTVKRT